LIGELYDEYGPRLYRYALVILKDPAAAEDAVQQTFYDLARMALRKPQVVNAGYATRAVRNQCFDALRRQRRRSTPPATLLESVASDTSEEERLIVEQALAALPVEQREVVYLKVYEGLTLQEIATLAGVSINTIASRYRYALASLRREMAPGGGSV
jgi:RNA polymerase sigma-70 factor (ECF subfamily)